jgi:hypothetical protein
LERNRNKIAKIRKKDIPVVNGKVKGSSEYFPFIETHYNVQMYEPKEMDNCNKQISILEKAINKDQEKVQAIENFINSIDNPELQAVFEMRVYEKMNWIDIAAEIDEDKDRTTYSKKYKNIWKIPIIPPFPKILFYNSRWKVPLSTSTRLPV